MLIAQLSDPHLMAEGALYKGVTDTTARLERVLDRLAGLRPDVLLATGDLAEDPQPAVYARLRRLLGGTGLPLLALPGNHDGREAFRAGLAGLAPLPPAGPLHQKLDAGPLRLIALDVTVPGMDHGLFDAPAQGWLEATLAEAPDRPTVLALHQPPYATGIAFMDAIGCFGAERLEAVVAAHPQVRLLVCGHLHRFSMRAFGGRLACTAPAIAPAIDLNLGASAAPRSLADPPAFLLHRWDGRGLTTHLVPLDGPDGPGPTL